VSFLAINWPWNFNLPITNTHFNFSFFLNCWYISLAIHVLGILISEENFLRTPFSAHFLGTSIIPPETFFRGLNFTHQEISIFKLLASQTLQTLPGIFLKYFIETLLAYFSWRNLKSKIEIKSSATKLLFLAIGLEIKCSIHPQILTFSHKNSCSATKLLFLAIGLEIYTSHSPKPIAFFPFFVFCRYISLVLHLLAIFIIKTS